MKLRYIDKETGKRRVFNIGDRVLYMDKYIGTILNTTNVRLDNGTLLKTLRNRTHRYVKL
jgi:hypothetical protein